MMISPNVPGHVTVMETADEKYKRLFLKDVLEVLKYIPLLIFWSRADIDMKPGMNVVLNEIFNFHFLKF